MICLCLCVAGQQRNSETQHKLQRQCRCWGPVQGHEGAGYGACLCVCVFDSPESSDMLGGVSVGSTTLTGQWERDLDVLPLWTILLVILSVCVQLHPDNPPKYTNRNETWVTVSEHSCSAVIMCQITAIKWPRQSMLRMCTVERLLVTKHFCFPG